MVYEIALIGLMICVGIMTGRVLGVIADRLDIGPVTTGIGAIIIGYIVGSIVLATLT